MYILMCGLVTYLYWKAYVYFKETASSQLRHAIKVQIAGEMKTWYSFISLLEV